MFSTVAEILRELLEAKVIIFPADKILKILFKALFRVNNGVDLLLYLPIYYHGMALWVRLALNRGSSLF